MKLLFNQADSGNFIRLLSPYLDINNIEDISDLYEVFSINIYKEICRNLNENKKVFVPKNVNQPELTLRDLVILKEDDELLKEKAKIKYLIKDTLNIKNFLGNMLIPLYKTTKIMYEFLGKGYYVNESNIEEIYSKMLANNDNQAIKDMDEYIKASAKLDRIIKRYDKALSTLDKIEKADNIEEFHKLYNDYMTKITLGNTIEKEGGNTNNE